FFGATAFAFSLTMTPWLLFSLSAVFCLWPWALFGIEWLCREPSSGRARLLLALVLGSWILAGHPESAVLGAILIGLFLAARALLRDETIHRPALKAIVASGLLGAGISAFLWIPELTAIRASNRYSLAGAIRESLPVTLAPHGPGWRYGFLTSIFPRVLGDDFGSPRLADAAASFPEMALGYFGIVGWAVAFGIVRPGARRDKRELALLAPLICGLAVGTGTWPIFDLFLSIPLVKLVLPLRSLAMVSLAGCAIAAFELDRVRRREGVSSRVGDAALAALLAAALVLAFLRFRSAHAASGGLVAVQQSLAVSLLALSAGTLVFLWPRKAIALSPAATVLLAAIGTAELFLQGATLYRWGAAADLFPPTPLVKFLQSQDRPFRVVGEDAALFPNTNVFAGVESIQTHDAMERRDYVTFLDATAGYDPKPYFKRVRDLEAGVLDFLNVRFLVTSNPAREESDRWKLAYSGPDGRVFENRRVLPRVFAPRQIRFEGPDSSSGLPNDWSDLAVVREHPEVSGSRVVLAQNLPVEVTGYRESTNRVAFRAFSSGPIERPILVTSLVQDSGWAASDEGGRPLTTLRANGIFLALAIEPGTHEVRLDYRPPGLAAGVAISLLSAAVLVWWVWVWRATLRTRGGV
ncbi:MAG TPA: YfhO family protein, partial [Thermoanaerobaculia bacterium]